MQTVFSYEGRNVGRAARILTETVRRELPDGDIEIEAAAYGGGDVRSKIHKDLSHPITMMRWVSNMRISFRRSWHHIRTRKAATRLIYFIRQGELKVVGPAGRYTVKSGAFTVINADEAFYSYTSAEDKDNFECALAIVPEHLVLSHMPWAISATMPLEVSVVHEAALTRLLHLLCFNGGRLESRTAGPLVEGFLQCISDSVGEHPADKATPESLVARRFADIQDCINKNHTRKDLRCNDIAALCQISSRYLCHILSVNKTSYSDLLWGQRLIKARDMLGSVKFNRKPIHQIGQMAGFKSPAHFSRLFRDRYQMTPNAYRQSQMSVADRAAGSNDRPNTCIA